ncbi:MAG: DUF2283 domain-containing protein [Bacteroidota bacterium]|nr:DUF2283 domain-containing protein [Bacteroidota bacterium]
METAELKEINNALPYFLKHTNIWSSYDNETDVLYLHFKKPNDADDSVMTDDEIIIRYENKEIIGITILNASQRLNASIFPFS